MLRVAYLHIHTTTLMAVFPETVNDVELKCSSIPYLCPLCYVEEGDRAGGVCNWMC